MNPLLEFWRRLVGAPDERSRRAVRRMPLMSLSEASATVFLILRRMRAPLICLILIFAVSVLGLTFVPAQDEAGRPVRMGFFDAFYFMSSTATTIGFGEIPGPFTSAQRLWVLATIYLTVIGWAYAIGSLLSLLQDRAFRDALALQRFTRRVNRLREPFLLIAGYGQATQLLGRAFDALGRRFVVVDTSEARIEALDLSPYHADVPGLVADARNPSHLGFAGLGSPYCEGVLALTDDDEANLAVTMAAALLRPDLPVLARTTSAAVGEKMKAFGTPSVVNPFDRFGDHLRLALRAPATYQLISWLENGPGAELPPRGRPPTTGRWVVCGYGRFGREITRDLRDEGLEVTIIEPLPVVGEESVLVGHGSEPHIIHSADLAGAVGFVAGTDNDTTNLSLVATARRANPDLFVAARQNRPENAPLFAAMDLHAVLVPTEVIAHEVYAQLSTPLLWRFLQEVPERDDAWAEALLARLTGSCGHRLQAVWRVRLGDDASPATSAWLESGEARLGTLLRRPDDRDRRLDIVPLLLRHGATVTLTPDDDVVLAPGDDVLLAGRSAAQRLLDVTMTVDSALEYVVSGRHVPSSWIWRRLAGTGAEPAGRR